MKILFSIGQFHIYFFGLMIAIGAMSAYLLALYQARKKKIEENNLTSLILIVLICGMIGARLFYILFYDPLYYLQNVKEVLRFSEGGLSVHGGIFTAMICGLFYCKIKSLPYLRYADILSLSAIFAQGIARIGCDVFGKAMITSMPWGIARSGIVLHPAQIYEFTLDYLLFVLLLRKSKNQRYDGELFGIYLIIFPIIRAIVEFFRSNPIVYGSFSISHVLSLAIILIGILIWKYIKEQDKVYPYATVKPPICNYLVLWLVLSLGSMTIFFMVQQ